VARRDKARCVYQLGHTHPYSRGHVTRPEILDMVEQLIGPNIKLYTDQTFIKPAHHGSEVPFHQDSAYWPAAEPRLLSCWLAIDDATIENGCVRMIPGSHRRPVPHREFDGVQQYGLLEEDVDASQEVPVEVPAGSAMFHHSLTIHRSFPNTSNRSRRGIVSIYLPADLHFHQPWPFPYGFQLVRGRDTGV
jgi:ectoine hydroxylase-related dioxygenase (phytanoyl-CoA dioxygenase family)